MNNNKRATKRALLTSVMALVMCVVMLVGTTFAWFTDTASTGVNKIQAGNLKVALEMKNASGGWDDAENQTLSFTNKQGSADILWEPGCTYELPELRIVNKGNLALKYKVIINGIKGDAKLNEAIDWTITPGVAADGNNVVKLENDPAGFEYALTAKDAVNTLTISGTMKTTAGNEYQGLSIDGIGITVVATQYTYEKDSIDDQYDAKADATIQVNKDNIQDYLDGKYGSIDGMTLVLAAGDYGQLELGRATKYAGSNTQYRIGSFDAEPMTFDAFYAAKNDSTTWTAPPYYTRSMNNVTFKAAEGESVTIAGVKMSSGHVYGSTEKPATDYVLDRTITDNGGYYLAQKVNNIAFEGIKFTAASDINTSMEQTIINGFTFKDCTFDLGYTGTTYDGKYVALRYYNENDNGSVSNLVVDTCTFKNCAQGVYTQKIVNVAVTNSCFSNTAYNAIAIQDGEKSCSHGAVVITGNKFDKIGADVIRFGCPGADTQITIKNNKATDTASDRQAIRAESLVDGITYDISGNKWNGAGVSHDLFKD